MANNDRCIILIDLDDTLLRNNMDVFLPAYFTAIEERFSGTIRTNGFMNDFMDASARMLQNDRPDQTLAEIFYQRFLGGTGVEMEDLRPVIDAFYREKYPELKQLTSPAEGASTLVGTLMGEGHSITIATNPLFPAAASRQRVEWADLPVKWQDFEMVTTFEHFHFAKPRPAYYAEILALLGWPDRPVIMIGNDPVNDIDGARELGLATFAVGAASERRLDDGRGTRGDRHGTGTLKTFPAWLSARSAEDLQPELRTPAGVLAVLRSTPAAIQSLLRVADTEAWHHKDPGAWSASETIAHLRDVERQVNLPRVQAILAQDRPLITGVDTDSWHAGGFGDLPGPGELLAEFLAARRETLQLLDGIDPGAWRRPARHTIFGPTDLLEITHIMSGHDRNHMRQIRSHFGGREIWY